MMKKIVCVILFAFLLAPGVKGQKENRDDFKSFAATDTIHVQPALSDSLPEISVVAIRPLVKAKVDKTSYNIQEDPDAKTNTLLEMLRKVPLVTVDGDDNVKVNGSSSFRIYMNGKPSNMLSNNPKEVLRSIPASTIKKVEVITEPGARYDAEGVSGILNIVTQGTDFEGYNASLQALVMNRQRMIGGYGMVKYGKLSLSANYSFSDYRQKLKSEYERRQSGRGEEAELIRLSDVRVKTPGHFGALEASYEMDSLNLITLSGSVDIGRNKVTSEDQYSMYNADCNLVYFYNQHTDQKENWGNGSFKTDYQHLFRRNKEEMLTLSYQYDYMPDDTWQYLHVTDKQGYSPSLQYQYAFNRQQNTSKGREHTIQLDYVNPFSDMHRIESGLKYIRRKNSSDAASEKRGSETDVWQPTGFQPFVSFRHIQNILAVYTGYTFSYGPWVMNPGLRMEHAWQEVDYKQGSGADFDYKATDWVPSLSVLRKLGDRQQLRLAYNMRLRRPGIGYLNPYVSVSGNGLRYGNPDLVSSKQHMVMLSYSYFGSTFNVQSTALYSRSSRAVGEYQFLDKEGVLNTTYDNLERINGGALTLYISYSPVPKTTVSLNSILQYLDLRPEKAFETYLAGVHNEGFSGSAFLTISQKLGKGWRLVCFGGYGRPEIKIGATLPQFYFYSCYVGKSFLNDKLTVALRGQNFLQSYRKTVSSETYTDFQAIERRHLYDRTFGLTVSYSLGGLKEKIRKATRSIENDDLVNKKR